MRRKQQNTNSSPTPRYVTIKIQYWPIPIWAVWMSLIIFIGYFLSFAISSLQSIETRVSIPYNPNLIYQIASASPSGAIRVEPRKDGTPQIVFHGPRNRREVALTFDGDMTSGMQEMLATGEVTSFYDQELITYLTKEKVKATLFLSGLWIESYPDVARDLAKNPIFELANHSYAHRSFSGDCYGLGEMLDGDEREDIKKTQLLLKEVAGKDTTLFRFPGGCYSQNDLVSAKEAGVIPVQWDVVSHDGFNDDGEAIFHNVVDNVTNGSIIVMHMNGAPNEPQTAQVVPRIVEDLRAKGYIFVTVSELFKTKKNPELSVYHSLVSL